MTFKIIVALDYHSAAEADQFIKSLDPSLWRLKVGITLFTQAGPSWIDKLHQRGFEVFLDLKFHDIPAQVMGACYQAAKLDVWMLNVHALGGERMMLAAKEGVDKANQPQHHRSLLIAVTILTSMDQVQLDQIGFKHSLTDQVTHLAKLASKCQLDGVVCSAMEANLLKTHVSQNLLCVTPGIRLPDDNVDDQSRVVTPWQALKAGSDHLVMGRSITRSTDPNHVMQIIQQKLI